MKNFKDYLKESTESKKHVFRVKIAGDCDKTMEDKLKSMMEKYVVEKFSKVSTTPIQDFPLDFPQIKNCEVTIFEVQVDYPTTQQELTEYLTQGLGVNRSHLVVRRPGEPTEEYQEKVEPREGSLLEDPDYKEAPNANFDDYYGDKYNSGFVKELNDLLKLERKARGEQIPTEGPAKFNTDSDPNTTSPLQATLDPRR